MTKGRITYVLLIAAVFSVPIYFLRDKMDTEEVRKQRYWIGKTHNSMKYPVLFGGDSRTFRGISPEHFEQEFGNYPSYNYAYWSNGMGRIYLEGLEEKIDTGADHQLILLGITPHSLTANAARCAHFVYERLRPKEEVLQQYYFSGVSEYFLPFKLRTIGRMISGTLPPANYRIIYHQNGWVESYWLKPDTTYSAKFYESIFTDNQVSEEVIRTLLEFTERWTRAGITVAGFRPPTSQAIRKLERERSGFDEEEFVRRFTSAGAIWIDVPPDAYQTFDGNHLEHLSAMRLSGDLGRWIREQIGPPAD